MTGSRHTSSEEHYVLVPVSQLRRSRAPRRVMLAVTLVAAIAAVGVGTGTFASFSASTNNDNNVFSTGAIKLSNKVATGSACFSGYTGTGNTPQQNLNTNDNGTCQAILSVATAKPGDTTSVNLTIANAGDYNGLLKFWLPGGCTDEQVASPSGSLGLCDKLEVYIQETSASFVPSTTTCVFPASAGSACSVTWGDAADNDDTLNDLAAAATVGTPAPAAGIAITAGATKYFKVGFRFANGGFDGNGNGADNGYQNKRAAFDVTWRLQEA